MKPASASLKQIVASALLALAFLGAQQAAVLHWLAHSIEATRAGKSAAGGPPVADHCDACLAFGALGAGAAPAEFPAGLPAAAQPLPETADPEARPALARFAVRSRAPPVLI